MCVNPLRVPNPSRCFTDGIHRTYLEVRCGKCCECQKEIQNEWFVRAFFEWKNVKKYHGDVWFALLTYDDQHLPFFYDEDYKFGCPCFNPDHIKHFRDTLRMKLINDGLDHTGIKYKICAEFGKDTARPHYHLLLFIPYELDKSYVMGTWKRVNGKNQLQGGLLSYAWPYGFVSWSVIKGPTGKRRLSPTLESDRGLEYSMKYIHKEDNWIWKYGLLQYFDYLKDLETDDYLLAKTKQKNIRRVMPRHFTSSHFGDDIIDTFKKEDGSFDIDKLKEGSIDLTKYGKVDKRKVSWKYPIPPTIMRKICYNLNDGVWQRNDIGVQVMLARHHASKKYLREHLEPYFDRDKYKALFNLYPHLKDREDEFENDLNYFYKFLGNRRVDDLVLYSTVYADIPLSYDLDDGVLLEYKDRFFEGKSFPLSMPEHNSHLAMISDLSPDEQLDYFYSIEDHFLISSVSNLRVPDPKNCSRSKDTAFILHRSTYGDIPCFKGLDSCLDIISKWEKEFGKCKDSAFKDKEDRKLKILSLYGPGWICEGDL